MRLRNFSFSGLLTMNYASAVFAFHRSNLAGCSRSAAAAGMQTGRNILTAVRSTSAARTTRVFATTIEISSSLSSSESFKVYQLDGKGLAGGTKVEATTNTGHSIATDIPKSMGGGDTAPQPVETLLGAWMGCTQATASFVWRQLLLEKARTQHQTQPSDSRGTASAQKARGKQRPTRTQVLLEFDTIRAYRDEKGALELPIQQTPSVPSRLQRIIGTIRVSLVPARGNSNESTPTVFLDDEELEVLKEQTEARCPIANMIVESGCVIDVEWVQ